MCLLGCYMDHSLIAAIPSKRDVLLQGCLVYWYVNVSFGLDDLNLETKKSDEFSTNTFDTMRMH